MLFDQNLQLHSRPQEVSTNGDPFHQSNEGSAELMLEDVREDLYEEGVLYHFCLEYAIYNGFPIPKNL